MLETQHRIWRGTIWNVQHQPFGYQKYSLLSGWHRYPEGPAITSAEVIVPLRGSPWGSKHIVRRRTKVELEGFSPRTCGNVNGNCAILQGVPLNISKVTQDCIDSQFIWNHHHHRAVSTPEMNVINDKLHIQYLAGYDAHIRYAYIHMSYLCIYIYIYICVCVCV